MERTLYNLCWDLLCVTPKTDLKMKSISREKEREIEGKRTGMLRKQDNYSNTFKVKHTPRENSEEKRLSLRELR